MDGELGLFAAEDDLVAGPEDGADDARIDVYGEGQSDDGPLGPSGG